MAQKESNRGTLPVFLSCAFCAFLWPSLLPILRNLRNLRIHLPSIAASMSGTCDRTTRGYLNDCRVDTD